MGIVNHDHVLIEKQTRPGQAGLRNPGWRAEDAISVLPLGIGVPCRRAAPESVPHVKNLLFCNVPGERILEDVADDMPDIVVPKLPALCSVSIYLCAASAYMDEDEYRRKKIGERLF